MLLYTPCQTVTTPQSPCTRYPQIATTALNFPLSLRECTHCNRARKYFRIEDREVLVHAEAVAGSPYFFMSDNPESIPDTAAEPFPETPLWGHTFGPVSTWTHLSFVFWSTM